MQHDLLEIAKQTNSDKLVSLEDVDNETFLTDLIAVLKLGLVPSAAGSAYYELAIPSSSTSTNLLSVASTVKLLCTVHGPKPLPRTASFTPNLQLSAHVKIAPFATRVRRGYIRDSGERDLSVHLETALRAIILAERYPKSAIDISVTVLEAEDSLLAGETFGSCGAMNVLAGCITVSSAALANAKVDCLDLSTGGVAITTRRGKEAYLDPTPLEHEEIESACVVGYLPTRDEITELWIKGDLATKKIDGQPGVENLIDAAVASARGAHAVLQEAVRESIELELSLASTVAPPSKGPEGNDVEMKI